MQKANLPRWKSCVASGLPSPEKKWNTGRKKRRNGSDSGSLLIHSKGESLSSSTGARNQAITEFERSRLKTIAAAWKQRICKDRRATDLQGGAVLRRGVGPRIKGWLWGRRGRDFVIPIL